MGAPFTAWLFSLHFPNLESWISVDSCQSEHNRTALCSFEPNLSGRTAKELRQLKIPSLPFHKIRSIHMLMPQASRASHGVHEGAPPRGPPIWLSWRLASPAALSSSGLRPNLDSVRRLDPAAAPITLAARTARRRPRPARCVMLPHRSVLAHIRGHLLLQVDRALERVSWRVSWRASWWPAEAAIILSPPLLTTPPRQGSGPAAARWRFR